MFNFSMSAPVTKEAPPEQKIDSVESVVINHGKANTLVGILSDLSMTPVRVRKLGLVERQDLYKGLTYVVNGMYETHVGVTQSKRRKGKGKGSRGGEGLYFPPPQAASRLNAVFNVFQTADLGAISSGAAPVTGAINFGFVQLNHAAALTAIFDQYRLAMVEVTFQPDLTIAAPTQECPLFYTVVDLDDSTAITIAQLLEYSGLQESIALKRHQHTFVPHVAVAAYSGAFTSFMNEEAPWIDVASPSVQHYGVKYGFAAEPSAASYGYNIKVRYHFQFRNVR